MNSRCLTIKTLNTLRHLPNTFPSRCLPRLFPLKLQCNAISTSTAMYPTTSHSLQPFLRKVAACNEGVAQKHTLTQFFIADQLVGYLLPQFATRLAAFSTTFEVQEGRVSLRPSFNTPEKRSHALADVMQQLKQEGVIEGWRDELYPITSAFDMPPLAVVERAAAVYLGIKSYGVHMNGYVRQHDGSILLWVGKRSATKSTWPGKLDHLVAGGQPVGISCADNLVKECSEEAGIPEHLARSAIPTSIVGCEQMQALGLKRDVLFVYDLQLPDTFVPSAQDGEVESFMLMPLEQVMERIAGTEDFKPNVELVVMDFCVRMGLFTPDQRGYADLLEGLRTGDVR